MSADEIQTRFNNAEFVASYADGPPKFVPGHAAVFRMVSTLLAERVPAGGEVLVLGAGGGLEMEYLARVHADWRLCGIDPSPVMLDQARARMDAAGAGDRVRFVEGYIGDAPEGLFDGATCLLTLHFVPDNGAKLETLREIRRRLSPRAPLILVDLCIDKTAPDAELRFDRYQGWALGSGGDLASVRETRERVATILQLVPPARDEALLHEAGFTAIDLFYAGLSWRGWAAYAW